MHKILIVDDEEDFVTTVEFFLKKNKFQVTTAYNGREALEKADQDKPDVILLDIMMPVMNGLQACRQFKSCLDLKDIPIIMLTAKGQKDDVREALSAGANDYIVKPFDLEELSKRIKKMLALGIGFKTIE